MVTKGKKLKKHQQEQELDTKTTSKKGGKDLASLLNVLDEKSRVLLWHLWWYRHADIASLRNLIRAEQDFEVLSRLTEVVNKKANDILGGPIVGFKDKHFDPLSGENILFNWWFLGEEGPSGQKKDELLDFFTEKNNVTIVAQLSETVDITCPTITSRNNIVKISFPRKQRPE
ncbi:MAG TPA: hypothetical protein DHV84_06150 [Desulfotomaculum sp.]|nr:hypothetical protein [Desulfotomaculum sp.]